MTQKEFEDLVKRLEVYSSQNPSVYALRVILLAVLGYLFLFAILAAVAAMVVAVIYVGRFNYLILKVLLIPLTLAFVILRSLWIKFPKPEGKQLQPTDAPRLFELVGNIRRATNGPRVHKILLTGDLNAGIVQRPRLRILGWQENYLLVGLPLLHAMSLSEFRAVLAHEFGHLSGNHSRFAGWIYRVRQTWAQILDNMKANRRRGSTLLEKFFNWYAPYFAAYSFVLARTHEYEADRCAVELSGKQIAARALINLELKNCLIEQKFLPEIFRKADTEPDPPADAFNQMLFALAEPVAADQQQQWFAQSLMRNHNYDDTHPSLMDRLVALGYPEVKNNPDISSFSVEESTDKKADHYLLPSLPTDLIGSRNASWKERVTPQWHERFQFVREAVKSLNELEKKAESQRLSVEEMWERARFTAGTKGYPDAIPFLREVLEQQPDHAAANYTLGEALLAQDDETGIKHIEQAMQKDISAVPAGCGLIYGLLTRLDKAEQAEKYHQRAQDYYSEVERAHAERQNISTNDSFKPHDLPEDKLRQLREQLAAFARVRVAYLVQKDVKHLPDEPGYVLGVVPKYPWYGLTVNGASQKLVNQLATQVEYAGYTYIIALEKNYSSLRKKFKQIRGAEIYRR